MCGLALKLGIDDQILEQATNIETGEACSEIEQIVTTYKWLKAMGEEPILRFEPCV